MMGESKEAFCTSHCIISVSLWLLTMRCVESCNCWLLSYETRSLSFIFTILSAMYDNPRSYCYSHALCPRNLYLYTTLACCHSLLVLLPFASAHPATYYYAYLPRIGILTDGALCTALADGVLVRSLGSGLFYMYSKCRSDSSCKHDHLSRGYGYTEWNGRYASDKRKSQPASVPEVQHWLMADSPFSDE